MSNEKKSKKKLIVIIVVIAVVVIVIAALVLGMGNKTKKFQKTEGATYTAVETAYGDLQYPDTNEKDLKVDNNTGDKTDDADYENMVFKYKNGDKEVVLFTICYNSNEGIPIGKYKNSGVTVSVILSDLAEITDWSQEEQDKVCAMQEGVNDIIANLHDEKNFEPAE